MWDVLAIGPTDDPKAIRRAYAARLRQIDPDREREAFARLREALEWALACARQPPRAAPMRREPERDPVALRLHEDVRVFPAEPGPASPRSEPLIGVTRASERALLIDLESALQRGHAREAVQLFMRAAATGALPLGQSERMLARLFTVALGDPSFDGPAFRDLAKSFGWERPELDSELVSEVRQRVTARLAAEDWYEGLARTAESKWLWFPRYKSRVARLLLRRIRGWGLARINLPALRATLDSLSPHAVWLRDRIPPEWIATLERRMRRRELLANGAAIVILLFFPFDAAFAIFGGIKETYALVLLSVFSAVLVWMLWVAVKYVISSRNAR